MRIWGVRDFYSNLERRSEEGSEFSPGFSALVIAATLLATGGLLANSVAVIIGSMCVAPFLGPSRAVCIGLAYRKWETVFKGLLKQMIGLLIIGSPIAFLVTAGFSRFVPEIIVTPEIMARMLPTLKDVYLAAFIAVSSGAAASLALVASPKVVSEPWRELLDAMIGVEIAISLIPPASVVGIGLAFGRFDISVHSLCLLIINVISLDIIGSLPVLYVWGIRPQLLQLENRIRRTAERVIRDVVKADRVLAEVTLHSSEKADVQVRLYAFEAHEHTDRLLAENVSKEIKKETGVSNTVRIIVIPVGTYTS